MIDIEKLSEGKKTKILRDLSVYNDYNALITEGFAPTTVGKKLMEKYNIYAYSTIFNIRRRVAKLLKEEGICNVK